MAAGLVSVARRQLREVTSIAQKAGIAMVLTLRTITWAVDTCANVTQPRASHLAAATVAPSRTRTDIGRGLRLLTGRSASRNPSRARLRVRAPDLSHRDRWRRKRAIPRRIHGVRLDLYPLSAAADPGSTKFLDAGDTVFDSTILYGTQLFESVTRRGRGPQPSAFDGTWKPADFRPAGSG